MSQMIENLAPHNVEAEEATIGAVLLSPEEAYPVVAPFLTADDFFIARHAWIWEIFTSLWAAQQPIDYLTVSSRLETQGRLEEIGGFPYLLTLINKTPSALNAEGYGRVVQNMAVRRRLIAAASRIAQLAHSEEPDINVVVDKSSQAIQEVTGGGLGVGARVVTHGTLMGEAFDEIGRRVRAVEGGAVGAGAGWPDAFSRDFEAVMGFTPRLLPGDLHVLALTPGGGKTSLAMQLAHHVAANEGKYVLFVHFENIEVEVAARSAALTDGAHAARLLQGMPVDRDWEAFVDACQGMGFEAASDRLYHLFAHPPSIDAALQAAHELRRRGQLDLLIVDYLQKLLDNEEKSAAKTDVIRGAVSRLKTFATGDARGGIPPVPVLVLSQFAKKVDPAKDWSRDDLYGGASIGQESQFIVIGARPKLRDYYEFTGLRRDVLGYGRLVCPKGMEMPLCRFFVDKTNMGPGGQNFVMWFQGERFRFLRLEDAFENASGYDLKWFFNLVKGKCER